MALAGASVFVKELGRARGGREGRGGEVRRVTGVSSTRGKMNEVEVKLVGRGCQSEKSALRLYVYEKVSSF
jgi:hypothetical protein